MAPNLSSVPLPRGWTDDVKSALVLSMAHMAMAHVHGRCADSSETEVTVTAGNERLRSEIELLREELRIKDARMARIPSRRRPRYSPVDRLAILQLKRSLAVIERFFLTLKTEAMRVITVPFSLGAMRAELVAFVGGYDAHRAHQSLGGWTPAEVYEGRERPDQTGTGSTARLTSGRQLALKVSYLEGR